MIPDLAEYISDLKKERQEWFLKTIFAALSKMDLSKILWEAILYVAPNYVVLEIADTVKQLQDKVDEGNHVDSQIDQMKEGK